MDLTLKEYKKRLIQAKKDLKGFNSTFLIKEATKINNKAKRRTPVDTGALRSSWKVIPKRINVKNPVVWIVNEQEYASFVEYGTKNMDRRDMITKPLQEYNEKVSKEYKSKLLNFFKKRGLS